MFFSHITAHFEMNSEFNDSSLPSESQWIYEWHFIIPPHCETCDETTSSEDTTTDNGIVILQQHNIHIL